MSFLWLPTTSSKEIAKAPILGLALTLFPTCACNTKKGGNQHLDPSRCPTPDRPYLHLDVESCRNLVPPPRLIQVSLTPPGGKVPIDIVFRATVEVPYPELREGLKILWDLDGTPGFDVTSPSSREVSFHYENCTNITISARAQDALGHLSNEIQRTLILRCRIPPRILFFYAQGPFGPPTGLAGTTIHFYMQAEDPDNEDPALIPSRGIVRYLFDADGDGTYDQETGGIFVDLGFNYTYTRIGNYLPVLRVEDGDGLATDSRTPGNLFPVLVQIFASFLLLGGTPLGATALSFAPMWTNGGEALGLLLNSWGYGFAERHPTYPALTWKVRGIPTQPSNNLKDLVILDHLGVALEPSLGFVFYALKGTDPAVTPTSPTPFTCPSQSTIFTGFTWSDLHWDPGPPPALAIFHRGANGGIKGGLFFDPSSWNTSVPDTQGLCNLLDPYARWNFDPEKIPGGNPQWIAWTVALKSPWFFVLVGKPAEPVSALAAYSLTDPSALESGTTLCPGSCLDFSGSGTYFTTLTIAPAPKELSLPLTYAQFLSDHYELPLTTYLDLSQAVFLYTRSTSYPESATTFQRLNAQRLRLETNFYNTLTNAEAITLAGGGLPLLVLGGGNALTIYSFPGSPPTMSPISNASGYPFLVDELLLRDGVIFVGDRSSPYIPFSSNPNLNPWERQRRGLYAIPLTLPSFWVRLLPRNENFVYLADNPGPLRLKPGLDSQTLWSLHAGVRLEMYQVNPYLLTATLRSGARTQSFWVTSSSLVLSDFATRVEVDPLHEQGFVSGGDQGWIAFQGGAQAPRWILSQDLGGTPLRELNILPGSGTRPTLFSGTIGERAWLWNRDGNPIRSFEGLGEDYLKLDLVASTSIDTPGKAILGARVNTPTGEELRLYPLNETGDLSEQDPRMSLPRDLPLLGDLKQQGSFVFGELDELTRLRVKHRYLWFGSGAIVCIDPVWRIPCPPSEAFFSTGPRGGILIRILSNGIPYLGRIDTATGLLDIFNMNGDLLTQSPFSVCAQVPVDEQRLCAQTFSIRDLKSVDPYLILVTGGGIFVLDLFKPQAPKLAVWIKGGLVYGAAGLLLGDRMRIYYTEGGTEIKALEIQGLFR